MYIQSSILPKALCGSTLIPDFGPWLHWCGGSNCHDNSKITCDLSEQGCSLKHTSPKRVCSTIIQKFLTQCEIEILVQKIGVRQNSYSKWCASSCRFWPDHNLLKVYCMHMRTAKQMWAYRCKSLKADSHLDLIRSNGRFASCVGYVQVITWSMITTSGPCSSLWITVWWWNRPWHDRLSRVFRLISQTKNGMPIVWGMFS